MCNGAAGTTGADGADGADAVPSLVSSEPEPAGATCLNGGQHVVYGLDDNADGSLGPTEVDGTWYVCNGTHGSNGAAGVDGLNSLVGVVDEAPGINCALGGESISYGLDDDDDGTLEPGEVDGVRYVCDGGTGGTGGAGAAGLSSLVSVVNEAAGINCAVGGERITYGLDDDRDGILDVGEVDGTRYACDGATGAAGTAGLNSLVSVVNEAAGINCAVGGERITYGLDDDRDSILDLAEVDGTRYVCDGATGAPGATGSTGPNGLSSLVSVTAEAIGGNCATGGQRIQVGLDDDGNGTLAVGEVDATSYVCNGAI